VLPDAELAVGVDPPRQLDPELIFLPDLPWIDIARVGHLLSVTFTGGTEVGRRVGVAAAQRFAGDTLEVLSVSFIGARQVPPAVLRNAIETNPLAKVKPLKVDRQGVIRYLTDDEERRLREALATREEEARAERESANRWRAERGYPTMPDLRAVPYVETWRRRADSGPVLALATVDGRGRVVRVGDHSVTVLDERTRLSGGGDGFRAAYHVRQAGRWVTALGLGPRAEEIPPPPETPAGGQRELRLGGRDWYVLDSGVGRLEAQRPGKPNMCGHGP
jgi:hypothetical protein